MMSVYADVADLDGLAASCAQGRALGFVGRTAIHPRQLPVIEAAFLPSEDEVARAAMIVDRVTTAARDGVGTAVLEDGTFLDVAMVEGARRTLALAERSASATRPVVKKP
jgi:citrate lyase subunit beta/citryl-CoA lyase